jgi:hypothetical protein
MSFCKSSGPISWGRQVPRQPFAALRAYEDISHARLFDSIAQPKLPLAICSVLAAGMPLTHNAIWIARLEGFSATNTKPIARLSRCG